MAHGLRMQQVRVTALAGAMLRTFGHKMPGMKKIILWIGGIYIAIVILASIVMWVLILPKLIFG